MNYNLFAYNIGGQPVEVVVTEYDQYQLSGMKALIISSGTTVTWYSDLTSTHLFGSPIENMSTFGGYAIDTYQTLQKGVRLCGYETGWSAMTNTEKDIIKTSKS